MSSELSPGTVLDQRYRVLDVLGRGGMGTVYRCHDATLDCEWAVKELVPPSGEATEAMVEQFAGEARLLARLRHAGLPRVSAFFAQEGRHYLVMERIHGVDLGRLLASFDGDGGGETGGSRGHKTGPLPHIVSPAPARLPGPLAQRVGWLAQILDILQYLHEQQPPVLFRDLSPSNVMIDGDRVFLVDFGLARCFAPDAHTRPALRGYGSTGYAPPEQYGHASSDPRSDLYALAATAYRLLTGADPPDAVHRLLGQATLPSPRSVAPELPAALARWLERGLALQPEERFRSAREMRSALHKAAAEAPTREPQALPTTLLFEPFEERLADTLPRNGWSRAAAPREPYAAQYGRGGLLRQTAWIQLVDPLREEEVQAAVRLAEQVMRQEALVLPSTSYFVLAGGRILNATAVAAVAAAATSVSRGPRAMVVIPVDLDRGVPLDRHVPRAFTNSNDLGDLLLNVRIAARKERDHGYA